MNFAVAIAAVATMAAPLAAHPIIDVHRHAGWPESDAIEVRDQTVEAMKRAGVSVAIVSITDYEQLDIWSANTGVDLALAAYVGCPRNLAAPRYKCFPADEGWVDIDWLRGAIIDGRIKALHEIGPNYLGLAIGNRRFAPYLELAAELDIPVGVHTGRGPPPGSVNSTRKDANCCPNYDPEMGNPALLRPVLDRHPDLRVWIQHVGAGGSGAYEPFWDETIALLSDYPNVYLDLSITNGPRPIQQYEAALRRLIDAGFEDRIMFGTDNLPYNLVLPRLNSIDWLSDGQRRAILHGNAERFFRLSEMRQSGD